MKHLYIGEVTATFSWYIKIFLSLKERIVWNSFHHSMRVDQHFATSSSIGIPITVIGSLPRHLPDCYNDLYSLYKTYLHNLSGNQIFFWSSVWRRLESTENFSKVSGIVELSVRCSSTESDCVMLPLSHWVRVNGAATHTSLKVNSILQ